MLKASVLAITLTMALYPSARADVIAQLNSPSQTGIPGETLAFFVTLTNTSASDQVWLNGIGSTASSSVLMIDTDPFNTNAPLFLDPQTSSGPFELFNVTIAPGTPAGGYIGSFASILGGPDGGTGADFEDLADVRFDVVVPQSAAAVPEPSNLGVAGFAALGLGLIGAGLWKKQSAKALR